MAKKCLGNKKYSEKVMEKLMEFPLLLITNHSREVPVIPYL